MPGHLLQATDVVPYNLVRSDDHVIGLELGEYPAPLPGISGVRDRLKVLGVLENLVVPVTRQRGRADDQGGQMF